MCVSHLPSHCNCHPGKIYVPFIFIILLQGSLPDTGCILPKHVWMHKWWKRGWAGRAVQEVWRHLVPLVSRLQTLWRLLLHCKTLLERPRLKNIICLSPSGSLGTALNRVIISLIRLSHHTQDIIQEVSGEVSWNDIALCPEHSFLIN